MKQRIYSANEFATVHKLNADYVRRCCRETLSGDLSKKCRLPVGKNGKQWMISRNNTGGFLIQEESQSIELALIKGTDLGAWVASAQGLKKRFHPDTPEDKFFAVLRELQINSILKDSGIIQNFPAFERAWLGMFSDAELAEIVSRRWGKTKPIKDFSDLIARPKVDFEVDYPVEDLDGLFSRLREAHKAAVQEKKSVELKVTFKPDGAWSTGSNSTAGDVHLQRFWKDRLAASPDEARSGIEDTFCRAWARYIASRLLPANADDHWWESLEKRCAYCGKKIQDYRTNKHYCSEKCKSGLNQWMTKRETSLVKRARKWWPKSFMPADITKEVSDGVDELVSRWAKRLSEVMQNINDEERSAKRRKA